MKAMETPFGKFVARLWYLIGPWRRTKLAGHFIGYSMVRFWNDRCFSSAAALSYSLLLALVPLFAIGFAVLAAFPEFQNIIDDLKDFVTREFVPKNINLKEWIDSFLKNTQGLTAIGILGLAVTTIIVLDTIEGKFNQIFRQKEIRPFGQRLMMFWAIVTLTPLLVGGSIALSEFVAAKTTFGADKDVQRVISFTKDILPQLLLVAAFTFSYVVIPYRRVRVWHALLGGIVATIMFTLLRWGFTVYFENFPAYRTIYGAFSLLPLFLVWLYLVWCAVLLGAQMVASLPEWLARRRMFGGSKPTRRMLTALSVLYRLYLGHKQGNPVPQSELSRQIAIEPSEFLPLLDELSDANLVVAGEETVWMLARDPRHISLFDLYRALNLHLAPDFVDQSSGLPWVENFRRVLKREEDAAKSLLEVTIDQIFLPEFDLPSPLQLKKEAAE